MLVVALLVVLVSLPAARAAPTFQVGIIASWTDGDTARVLVNRQLTRVRLIGMDTPEISAGARAEQQGAELGKDVPTIIALGRRAKAASERLAPRGTRVQVELDVQAYDRYARLLAYLWTDDGRMINEELVRQGWAMVLTIPPNVRYADRFLRAQRDAREARRGLWGP